jgi:hypothetical protein
MISPLFPIFNTSTSLSETSFILNRRERETEGRESETEKFDMNSKKKMEMKERKKRDVRSIGSRSER